MANPIVKGQYGAADNPLFEIFTLADARAVKAIFQASRRPNT